MKKIKSEYLILSLVLSFSAFFRLFRLNLLLGFWYDQGRDALVISDLLHYGKFFLIGPVTGIEGIFLGPFYYYLLVPFYWLGKGSPVVAAAGLGWITIGAIFLIYLLAKQMYDRRIGLVAAFLYGFSYNLVVFSRWLANPNPLPFFTLLVLIFLYKFISCQNFKFLILSSFLIGLCLQLEAASAVFFLPATLAILIWQRKRVFGVKYVRYLVLSMIAFSLTLFPQIVFNFRHQGILVSAFRQFLVGEKSFSLSLGQMAKMRVLTYYEAFFSKLIPNGSWLRLVSLALFSATAFFSRKKIFNQGGKLLLVWLIVPILGFFFYRGNHGYVWDYYFTGVIPAFFILFSVGLTCLWQKNMFGKVMVGLFLTGFLTINIQFLNNYYKTGIGITLRAQERAIDWIYNDAGESDFNVDVYVPPQIYFSYSYLFQWYGKAKFGREPETKLVNNLYTLEEPDGEHPQFLVAWLKRQEEIGRIVKEYSWGDITVQKRERVKYE